MSAEINRTIAADIWRWCRDAGVTNLVLCAGARNAPLMLPLLERELFPKVWHHFDERAASFFALGLAKKNGNPCVVITTSGTAVAECLPAVIEAHYSAIPLIIISADRPRNFRGSGAPQAIEQRAIFGDYVEAAFDIEDAEGVKRIHNLRWTQRGPLHLNVSFDEPLIEPSDPMDLGEPVVASNQERTSGVAWGFPEFLSAMVMEGSGIVLLGEISALGDDRKCVTDFLIALGLPVYAEAQSGLRESKALAALLIRNGDSALASLAPKFVLRIGGVPSCRFWRDLEDLPDIEVFSVSPTGFVGLAREARIWETELTTLGQVSPPEAKPVVLPEVDSSSCDPELELVRQLSEIIPSDASIFLGNSLPIREWNHAASVDSPHPNVFASRGANGIDGQISTCLGIAAESDTDTWGIFGDLTSLYDLNAPWILQQIASEASIRIVVINNAGGRIFSKVPVFDNVSDTSRAVIENRHTIDFSHWATMWGLDYVKVESELPASDQSFSSRIVIELVVSES